MGLFVAGMNHRTASVGVREQLALEEDKLREILREVLASGGMSEAVIVSTCNRVELYGVAVEMRVEERLDGRGIEAAVTAETPEGHGSRLAGDLGDPVDFDTIAGRDHHHLVDHPRVLHVAEQLSQLVLLDGERLAQLDGGGAVAQAGDEERHQDP